jgi:hypothetical protein
MEYWTGFEWMEIKGGGLDIYHARTSSLSIDERWIRRDAWSILMVLLQFPWSCFSLIVFLQLPWSCFNLHRLPSGTTTHGFGENHGSRAHSETVTYRSALGILAPSLTESQAMDLLGQIRGDNIGE